MIDFGMTAQEAVEAPRFQTEHFYSSFAMHEFIPGKLNLEGRIPKATADALTALGHKVTVTGRWGNLSAPTVIKILPMASSKAEPIRAVTFHFRQLMRLLAGALLLCASLVRAQDRQPVIAELTELLSIPNVGSDHANIERNAAFLRAMLQRHGMSAEVLETAGNPLVYGEKKILGASRTVLFYIHYDGQPIDAARWKQPSPFTPVLRDARLEEGGKEIPDFTKLTKFSDNWCLYARSASDDKAPIVEFCAALDNLRGKLTNNIRVILGMARRKWVRDPARSHRQVPGQAARGSSRHPRWTHACQRTAHPLLRRARWHRLRTHRVRFEVRLA